ncbi:MAG: cytidine deaminase [Lentisphaerae bacterium]|nr:cytidine deaminase [Lentisphaerota bacterium]
MSKQKTPPDPPTARSLAAAARKAATRAHAPYSGFHVGAALLAGDGRIFTGCNIENASYGLTLCAERVALAKAVSEGATDFRALAIAGGTAATPATPCGACRQVLAEFCPPRMPIWYAGLAAGTARATTLGKLLPHAFTRPRTRGLSGAPACRMLSPTAAGSLT